jgi:hypothetical protein
LGVHERSDAHKGREPEEASQMFHKRAW